MNEPTPIEIETIPALDDSLSLDASRPSITTDRDMGGLKYQSVSALLIPSDMSDDDKKAAFIFEALKRPTLEWWQKCVLEKQFHEMRQEQHGTARKSGGRGKTGWSLRDTAEEMQIAFGMLSEDIKLAEACMADPGLMKVEDKVTAKRLIRNKAVRLEAEQSAAMPTEIDYNTALCGDAGMILESFPTNTFNVCITDPPWLEYIDKSLTKDDQTVPVFDQLYRVMAYDSLLYAFVSTDDWIFYRDYLTKLGFHVSKQPLLWQKLNHVSHGVRPWEYMRDFEPIILAAKGSPSLVHSTPPSSIFTYPIVHPTRSIHPNEKPIELIKQILGQSSYDGTLVIDPFGGSGVVAHACIDMGRRWVTIERDRARFERIQQRLSNRGEK